MITKIFPSFNRFAYLCILVGAVLCILGLMEFYSYRSVFASEMSSATSTEPFAFLPIQEVSVANMIYGLAAIVGGIGLALHKNWGKIILLILGWILMLYAVGFGIYFQIYIGKFSQAFLGMQIYFRIVAIIINILFIYAILSLIKYIYKNKVRQPNNKNLN